MEERLCRNQARIPPTQPSSTLEAPSCQSHQMCLKKIRQEWSQALPNLDCTSDKTFCHVKDSCENVAPKVKPVGF